MVGMTIIGGVLTMLTRVNSVQTISQYMGSLIINYKRVWSKNVFFLCVERSYTENFIRKYIKLAFHKFHRIQNVGLHLF